MNNSVNWKDKNGLNENVFIYSFVMPFEGSPVIVSI